MLRIAANVYETALQVLARAGYELAAELDDAGQVCGFEARRDGFRFSATNPVELLGLVAIRDAVEPAADTPYWWRLDGSLYKQLIASAKR